MDIKTKIDELEEVISFTEKNLEQSPAGSLIIQKNNDGIRYYWDLPGKTRKYLGNLETNDIIALEKKYYCKKLKKTALQEKKKLEKINSLLSESLDWKSVYYEIPVERRHLIEPYETKHGNLSKKEIEAWLLKNKEKNDVSSFFLTQNGEYVRSKSELIIADRLKAADVPYHYESGVGLVDDRLGTMFVWHPDFKVLNVRNGKELYWEHFGKMDEHDYFSSTMLKLETYARNNIFIGDNLIITMETSKRSLNTEYVDLLINRFLK